MTDCKLTPVVDGHTCLEGPRWHDGRLWMSDLYCHQVDAASPEARTEVIAAVRRQLSGLGWLPDGRMLVVSMRDRKLLLLENGEVVEHGDLPTTTGGHINDTAEGGKIPEEISTGDEGVFAWMLGGDDVPHGGTP